MYLKRGEYVLGSWKIGYRKEELDVFVGIAVCVVDLVELARARTSR